MSLANYLKRCIPEFQQREDTPLARYLEVSGEFLGDFKEAIEQFDHHREWRKGSELSIDMSNKQRGFTLPSNMALKTKRIFLRDVAEVIKRNGTEDGLIHALKMIGYEADVRSAWIPCAERLDEGYLVDVQTGEEKYHDIKRDSYWQFLYGDEVVTDNGVYFSGFRYYDDPLQNNKIENIPITGEYYEEYQPHNRSVTKSPYFAVRLKNGEFNVDVAEYTNPITGKTYKYSNDEEFQLVNEIVEYFIKTGYRATTIRAIIVAFLQQFDDTFYISENFIELTEYVPDGGDNLSDTSTICENGISASRVFVVGDIGSNMVVGSEIPYESPLSIIKPLPIGMDSDYVNEKKFWNEFTNKFSLNLSRQYPDFLVRFNTDIKISNTSYTDISVYVNGELLTVVGAGSNFGYRTDHIAHKIKLTPSQFIDEVISVTFDFAKVNQDLVFENSDNCRDFLVDTLKEFDDSIIFSDTFTDNFTHIQNNDTLILENIGVDELTTKQGSVFVLGEIGSNMVTGSQVPFESPISVIEPLPIGTNSDTVNEIYSWSGYVQNINVSLTNQQASILLRYNTIVEIDNTSSVDIDIFVDGSLMQRIGVGNIGGFVSTYTNHKLKITPTQFVNESVNIKLTFNQFNQNGEDL